MADLRRIIAGETFDIKWPTAGVSRLVIESLFPAESTLPPHPLQLTLTDLIGFSAVLTNQLGNGFLKGSLNTSARHFTANCELNLTRLLIAYQQLYVHFYWTVIARNLLQSLRIIMRHALVND